MFGTLDCIVFALYLVATGLYFLFFFDFKRTEARLARLVLLLLLLLHLGVIVVRAMALDRPILASRAEALSVTAWCLGVMYLAVELLSKRAEFGGFVLALATLFQFLSLIHPVPRELPPILKNPGFVMHAWMNIMAYSGFFLSFLFSVLLLVMRREIKTHHLGWLFRRLPSIQTLDVMSAHSATVGFVLLTAGLVAGSFWAKARWGSFFPADPKLISSAVVWVVYAVYVFARAAKVKSQQFFAALSIIGFCAIMFAFVFVHGIGSSIHGF